MNTFDDAVDFEAAFEATTDPMAVVEESDSEWTVRDLNGSFEETFDCHASDVRGDRLGEFLECDLPRRSGDGEVEFEVALSPVDERYLLRVRPLDADGPDPLSLVVFSPSRGQGPPEYDVQGGTSLELHGTIVEMTRADDVRSLFECAAELFLDDFGFDAMVADVDPDPPFLANVDAPIDIDGGDGEGFVARDVRDQANGTTWGYVVQQPVGDRGVVQVAVRDGSALAPGISHSVELVARYMGTVLDRMDRERSLRAEREELAMTNRVLRHSVLNGLNLIRARLDFLEGDVTDDNWDHYDTAYTRVDDMIDRVEVIRDMQTGDDPTETDTYALDSLVRERVERAAEKYPEASFSMDGPVPDVTVEADDLVHFCLRNLLRNSVQHADLDAPEVRVSVDLSGELARVHVTDNGLGIPDELSQSIFEEGVSSLDGEAHGVGLFLTRKIVEDVYGGDVSARESDRGGAEFVVGFPVADP